MQRSPSSGPGSASQWPPTEWWMKSKSSGRPGAAAENADRSSSRARAPEPRAAARSLPPSGSIITNAVTKDTARQIRRSLFMVLSLGSWKVGVLPRRRSAGQLGHGLGQQRRLVQVAGGPPLPVDVAVDVLHLL